MAQSAVDPGEFKAIDSNVARTSVIGSRQGSRRLKQSGEKYPGVGAMGDSPFFIPAIDRSSRIALHGDFCDC